MLCQLVLVSCLALLSVADAQAITVLAPQPSASYALNVPVTISWSAPGKCQKKNVKLNLYHFERGGYSFIQEIAESLPLTNSEGTYDWEWSRKGQFFHLENRFDDDRYSVEIVTFDDGQNDQCQVYSPTFFLVVGLPGRTTRPVVTIQNHEEQPAMQGGNGGAVVAAVLIPLVAVGVIFICLRFYRQKQINLANNDNVARNAHPTTARPGSMAAEDDLAEVRVAGLQLEPVKKKQEGASSRRQGSVMIKSSETGGGDADTAVGIEVDDDDM